MCVRQRLSFRGTASLAGRLASRQRLPLALRGPPGTPITGQCTISRARLLGDRPRTSPTPALARAEPPALGIACLQCYWSSTQHRSSPADAICSNYAVVRFMRAHASPNTPAPASFANVTPPTAKIPPLLECTQAVDMCAANGSSCHRSRTHLCSLAIAYVSWHHYNIAQTSPSIAPPAPALPSPCHASDRLPRLSSCCHDNCLWSARSLSGRWLKHAVSRPGRCCEPLGKSVCACCSPIGWFAPPPNVGC